MIFNTLVQTSSKALFVVLGMACIVAGSIPVYADSLSIDSVTYDRTEIEKIYLDAVVMNQAKDREYFMRAIGGIEEDLKKLRSESADALKGLSDLAFSGNAVEAVDFLASVNSYVSSREALNNRIQGLSRLENGGLPSQSDTTEFASVAKFDLKPLIQFYTQKIEETDQWVQNLSHLIKLPNGSIHIIEANSGKGLDLPKQDIGLSDRQIREMKREVLSKKTWALEDRRTIDSYTRFLRMKVQAFIHTYGATEKYRFHSDEDSEKMYVAAKEIATAFWTRSYLRAQYGMPFGAIGFHYNKRWANLDRFTVSSAALTELMEAPVWGENDYIYIKQSYENALKVTSVRGAEIFDGNTTFLEKANYYLTYLSGETQYSQAADMMLRMLAGDLYEEMLIIQPGGKKKMIGYYKSKYFSTKDDEAYYRGLRKTFDSDHTEDESFEADSGAFSAGGDSLMAKFSATGAACKTQEGRLAIATDLEKKLALLDGSQNSTFAKRRNNSDL